ncbi:hypothetical protein C7S16_3776 [Burkholderia thailandensis]|uniref:Phenol hydroxylase n=1 Tax=Burkholderia thailandensis TaxID=57975 RepID=A0AAW9D2M0_BURTH|nr:hypothetical protein [Burkholderia thailandensis]
MVDTASGARFNFPRSLSLCLMRHEFCARFFDSIQCGK